MKQKILFTFLIGAGLMSFISLRKEKTQTKDRLDTNYASDTLILKGSSLPDLDSIKHITYLDLYDPAFGNLPHDIGRLTELRVITAATNSRMTALPAEIGQLENLRELRLTKVFNLKKLPNEICNLHNLTNLTVAWGGHLQELPDSIGKLKNLVTLDLGRNNLSTLPESIKNLKQLKSLVLWQNPISKTELLRIQKLLPTAKIYINSPLGY